MKRMFASRGFISTYPYSKKKTIGRVDLNKKRLSAEAQFDYTKKVLVNIIIVYGLDTAPVVLASLWQGRGVGSVVMKIASGSCPISVPACSDLNSPISSHYAGPHKFCVMIRR